ncbi:glucosamine-6-phosphate deaminase [Rummeliibacillus sp. NPDC094406]|uniref:glucosamine-6-phosphate deaminase n=1 Tax=Rummeliibacillus sp. NPDC094406 TaxID=3364511 RepID=UPI0038143BE6
MTIQLESIQNLDQLFDRAFSILEEQKNNGAKTFGLATGGTMLPLYERIRNSSLDFSNCKSVNLDEYVGLPKKHQQSYISFMQKQLFNTKSFEESYLPNGEAENPEMEAVNYENILKSLDLDFQLLGVGENGHIGFNEPGSSFSSETHVVTLTESTRQANARFFESIDEVPKHAITMGIASIMRAHQILLIAVGEKKRDAIQALIDGEMTEEIPVTVLKGHDNVIILTNLNL